MNETQDIPETAEPPDRPGLIALPEQEKARLAEALDEVISGV